MWALRSERTMSSLRQAKPVVARLYPVLGKFSHSERTHTRVQHVCSDGPPLEAQSSPKLKQEQIKDSAGKASVGTELTSDEIQIPLCAFEAISVYRLPGKTTLASHCHPICQDSRQEIKKHIPTDDLTHFYYVCWVQKDNIQTQTVKMENLLLKKNTQIHEEFIFKVLFF